MLKTAAAGTTGVTGVKNYLEGQQRQEVEQYRREWDLYEQGQVNLSPRQAGYLQEYLTAGSRGLAIDVSPDLTPENWARQMDLTREHYGHDGPSRKGAANRTYYHFILSPAMEDACSLPTMRAYARSWAEENFRNQQRRHEYAIVYHDDNTKGILHAHMVVNVTNKLNGRKLHLSNDEVVALQLSAQEIGRRYGLTPLREQMQTTIGARTMQPIYLDRAEREILSKGGYSWKWELRRKILQLVPLSSSLEDLKARLKQEGYDVSRSQKTGYLLYTHRNGRTVKDSRLGAYFYEESLEQLFTHERLHDERTYKDWELMKISKGEVPWKEEIRRAVDSIAPTVLSVPELQEALMERFGIRLTVNRRGITYQHAAGFKVRDVGIGFRYTLEGLEHNAAVSQAQGYPGTREIGQVAGSYAQRFLPGSKRGAAGVAVSDDLLANRLLFQDVGELMERRGASGAEELGASLEQERQALTELKNQLSNLRSQVMRWNHLAVLQQRMGRDKRFLEEERDASDPAVYNETLLRYERLRVYLHEQAGDIDPEVQQRELNQEYLKLLEPYQLRVGQLQRDQGVYQNYLLIRSVDLGLQAPGKEGRGVGLEVLLAASRTLEEHHVQDFFHLNQLLSSKEFSLEFLQAKVESAGAKLKDLQLVRSDIQAVRKLGARLPRSAALDEHSPTLELNVQKLLYEGALQRLEDAGIHEESYELYLQACLKAEVEYRDLRKELSQLQAEVTDLREAQTVSRSLASILKGEDSREPSAERKVEAGSAKQRKREQTFDDLPIQEARRRKAEHLKASPDRSKQVREELSR